MEPERQPFDLGHLSRRIDQVRDERDLSMAALTREVGVSASTIRRFGSADDAEADGVLALIAWLGEPPEDFIAESAVAGVELPSAGAGQIRVDMSLVDPDAARRGITRTTIQRLAAAAQSSGRPIASLTRWSEV